MFTQRIHAQSQPPIAAWVWLTCTWIGGIAFNCLTPTEAAEPAASSPAEVRDADAAERPAVELPNVHLSPPAVPQRSSYGGDFRGTWAFDSQVGYDYGQYDDNGRASESDAHTRGKGSRMPGKRAEPGDRFDAYRQHILRHDGTRQDYDDLGGYLEFHGRVGQQRYWRSQRYIPLRYDDFSDYQRFRYELGNGQ